MRLEMIIIIIMAIVFTSNLNAIIWWKMARRQGHAHKNAPHSSPLDSTNQPHRHRHLTSYFPFNQRRGAFDD